MRTLANAGCFTDIKERLRKTKKNVVVRVVEE